MEQMKDLKDLLQHEIQDLYSAEQQIIAAMPKMIEKANNPELKKALQQHLKVTENQVKRLDKVKKAFGEEQKKKSGLFGLFSGEQKCKGMEGLITEGEKVMGENMTPEVLDAAIIACAQKIEHYEICGYGTARAYARELNMGDVAELLEETLDEEYEADDLLTDLAVGNINEEAEEGEEYEMEEEEEGAAVMASNSRNGNSGRGGNNGRSGAASSSRSNTSRTSGKAPAKTNASRSNSGSSSSSGRGSNTSSSRSGKSQSTSGGRSSNNSGRGGTASGSGRSAGRTGAAKKGGAAKKSSRGSR